MRKTHPIAELHLARFRYAGHSRDEKHCWIHTVSKFFSSKIILFTRTYFGSRINLTRSPSNLINILLSFGVLFNVFLIKSSKSIPVESLYGVSTLESTKEQNVFKYPMETFNPCSPFFSSYTGSYPKLFLEYALTLTLLHSEQPKLYGVFGCSECNRVKGKQLSHRSNFPFRADPFYKDDRKDGVVSIYLTAKPWDFLIWLDTSHEAIMSTLTHS